MDMILEIGFAVFLLIGGFFTLVGSIGLARLPDFFMRLHGTTKGTTLGVAGILLASAIWFSSTGAAVSVHEVLITIFLVLTSPVSAHMLSKAALHLRLPVSERTRNKPEV